MRCLAGFVIAFLLLSPCLGQAFDEDGSESKVLGGYLYQNAITPDSILITTVEEYKAFVAMLPPVTPYKILPAPANPDPLLKGYEWDFEESVLAVAVGRNRISRAPIFEEVREYEDGSRDILFRLSAPTAEAYPFGWAVYTAVVVPRRNASTTIIVRSVPIEGE